MYTFTQSHDEGQIQIGNVRIDTSTSERLNSWKESIAVWKKSPIWGQGVTGGPFMDAMYPRVLSETGLLGVAAFLALIMAIGRIGRRVATEGADPYVKGLAVGFVFGFIGLLVHAIGANTFIIVRIMEPFWLVAALTTCMYMHGHTALESVEDPVMAGQLRAATGEAN
jgi:O-antigen ligase